MKKQVVNLENKKVKDLNINTNVFGIKLFPDIIHQYIRYQNAKSRQGTHKTKSRSDVNGRAKKPFAQKGTGNARHASKKAPIFVGGGVAHGPKGELAYKKRKLNKSEKKQSITSLISEKTKNKDLLVLNDFNDQIKKTKEMCLIFKKFEITNSLIILDKSSKEKVEKSMRNIPNIKVTDINHFSAFDMIKFKKIVFTESSVKELEKRYA